MLVSCGGELAKLIISLLFSVCQDLRNRAGEIFLNISKVALNLAEVIQFADLIV